MTLGTTDGAPTSLESPARQIIELDVQGMTCASCAARIEEAEQATQVQAVSTTQPKSPCGDSRPG